MPAVVFLNFYFKISAFSCRTIVIVRQVVVVQSTNSCRTKLPVRSTHVTHWSDLPTLTLLANPGNTVESNIRLLNCTICTAVPTDYRPTCIFHLKNSMRRTYVGRGISFYSPKHYIVKYTYHESA